LVRPWPTPGEVAREATGRFGFTIHSTQGLGFGGTTLRYATSVYYKVKLRRREVETLFLSDLDTNSMTMFVPRESILLMILYSDDVANFLSSLSFLFQSSKRNSNPQNVGYCRFSFQLLMRVAHAIANRFPSSMLAMEGHP
jgi:hypothetical protein